MHKVQTYSIYRRISVSVLIPFLVLITLLLGMYQAYYSSMLRRAEENFSSLAEQKRIHIESKLDDVRAVAQSAGYSSIAQKYFVDMDGQERVNNYRYVRQMFMALIGTNPAIQGIYMMDGRNAALDSGTNTRYLFERANMEYGLPDVVQTQSFFTGLYAGATSMDPLQYCIFYYPVNVILPISTVQNSRRLTCAVLFNVPALLKGEEDGNGQCEALIWNDQIIAEGGKLSDEERSAIMENAVASEESCNVGNYYLKKTPLSCGNGLSYVFLTSLDSLGGGTLKVFWNFSLVMIAACTVAVFFLMILLRRIIARPLAQITDDMAHITAHTPSIRNTEVIELEQLTNGINHMLAWLNESRRQEIESNEKIYQLNLRRVQSEMLAYRSQINPHFLFNTLECMSGMALYYRIEPLEQLVSALSDSFRYTLRTPDMVELEQEIAHLKNYMRIMDIRMPGRYRLVLRVAPETLSLRVLSLILQPLAENAVLHGFEGAEKAVSYTLMLMARKEEAPGRLHIRMADNGNGMSEESLAAIRQRMTSDAPVMKKHHVALNNIYRRMKIVYGDQGRMEITAKQGYYTVVDIYIPLDRME